MQKTVVELDLKGYSDVARELEEHISAEVVLVFNSQIQRFVDSGLNAAGVPREESVMATTGDGAILVFDSPEISHVFAAAIHDACRVHNHEKTVASAKRWFRIGIATGPLAIKTKGGVKEMAGSVIARAVRLEAAGNIGEILVDTESYLGLSDAQKALYDPEESIRGKRDEVFSARRCVVLSGVVASSAQMAKPTSPLAPPGRALKTWQAKLDFLQEQAAIVAGASQKFEIKMEIAEAREKIAELGG
jgi:class 3 adenylate cyclase